MVGPPALYYRLLGTTPNLLKGGNILGRPYCWTMTVTLYHMHILYIYITPKTNCHDGIVIGFTKTLEFISELAWALFVLIITKSKSYLFYLCFPLSLRISAQFSYPRRGYHLSQLGWYHRDLIRVIFEDMDPVWLRSMRKDGGITRDDMIEILISLALLKLRSSVMPWYLNLQISKSWRCNFRKYNRIVEYVYIFFLFYSLGITCTTQFSLLKYLEVIDYLIKIEIWFSLQHTYTMGILNICHRRHQIIIVIFIKFTFIIIKAINIDRTCFL